MKCPNCGSGNITEVTNLYPLWQCNTCFYTDDFSEEIEVGGFAHNLDLLLEAQRADDISEEIASPGYACPDCGLLREGWHDPDVCDCKSRHWLMIFRKIRDNQKAQFVGKNASGRTVIITTQHNTCPDGVEVIDIIGVGESGKHRDDGREVPGPLTRYIPVGDNFRLRHLSREIAKLDLIHQEVWL